MSSLPFAQSFDTEADALAALRATGVIIGIVDCTTPPTDHFPELGMKIIAHRPCGLVAVNSLKLYQSPEQRIGCPILVDVLVERLKTKRPGNINMLAFLYRNQHLIPEEWKRYKGVGFTGTTVMWPDDSAFSDCNYMFAPLLYWQSGSWSIYMINLVDMMDAEHRLVISDEQQPTP